MATLRTRLFCASPPTLLAGYLIYAILMIMLTAAAELNTFPVADAARGMQRTKGYWFELNWGFTHLALIPVALLCSALVVKELQRIVDRIAGARMFADRDCVTVSTSMLTDERESCALEIGWFAFVVVAVGVACYVEWFATSLTPLLRGHYDKPAFELGWPVGALFSKTVSPAANATLTFVAYTAQWFVTTFFLYVLGSILAFCIWLYGFLEDSRDRRIIPNLASTDVRRGFEEFEQLAQRFLYFALAFVCILFALRVQAVYDASASPAENVWQFIRSDIVRGFITGIWTLIRSGDTSLFDAGNTSVYMNMIACAAMCLLITMVLVVPSLVLSMVAGESRRTFMKCIDDACGPFANMVADEKAKCRERLRTMKFWPMQYPRPFLLVVFVVCSGICFVFYKLTFALFGAWAIKAVYEVFRIFLAQAKMKETEQKSA